MFASISFEMSDTCFTLCRMKGDSLILIIEHAKLILLLHTSVNDDVNSIWFLMYSQSTAIHQIIWNEEMLEKSEREDN